MEMYGIMRNRGEMQMNIATYQTISEKHEDKTFFFTDCGIICIL